MNREQSERESYKDILIAFLLFVACLAYSFFQHSENIVAAVGGAQ